MFKDLLVFEKERNIKEAFGFYLAHNLLGVCGGAMFGAIANKDFYESIIIGARFAVFFCLALCFIVLFKKNLLNNFGLILLAILSGTGAYLYGTLLGLIPVAYFTTKKVELSR